MNPAKGINKRRKRVRARTGHIAKMTGGSMKARIGVVIALVLGLVLIGAACGKKAAEPSAPASAGGKTEAPAPRTSASPADLAAKIGSSYIETLTQVVAILKDKKPAAEVKTMLQEFKSATIDLMVGLGKEREALPAEDRAKVDSMLSLKFSSVPSDLFKEYQEGQAAYKGDSELFNLVADFNIITQYACFDLLKKQLPAEAERLGIK
jgi:hypothetical protein